MDSVGIYSNCGCYRSPGRRARRDWSQKDWRLKAWRLIRHAERRLAEIAEWTAKAFGSAQALAYQDALIERINLLASGDRPCKALMYRRHAVLGLLYHREGNHYIIMRETK
jgi:plasmid stabilization system protein ParE